MKIAHVIFGLVLGGAESMLVNIINEQVKTGNEISLHIVNDLIDESLYGKIDPRVRVECYGRRRHSRNPWPLLRLNWRLTRMNPDVIHLHSYNLPMYISPNLRGRTCMTLHTITTERHARYLRWVPTLYAISDIVAGRLRDEYHRESTVVLNGITVSAYTRRTPKTAAGRGDTFRIVCLGRLCHLIKGQHVLIEAISKLDAGLRRRVRLDFIGEGDSHPMLEELSSRLLPDCEVRFAGARPPQHVAAHLADYDLLVQPSLFEGFGLTVAEAMAARVPVLVSDSMGPYEVIDSGNCGYAFKTGDSADCARALARIMTGDDDDAMLERAYQRAAAMYDIKQTAAKYIDCYRQKSGCRPG